MGANASTFGDEDFSVPGDLPPAPAPTGSCGGTGSPPGGGGGTGTPPGNVGTGTPATGGAGGSSTIGGSTLAQIASALGADLKAMAMTLRTLRIGKLLRGRGFTAKSLDALTAGRFVLQLTGGARGGRRSRVTIATGSRTVSRPGPYSLKVKLTTKGERVLRRARRLRGTLTLRFTPRSGRTQTSSATLNLKR
jgi:hypothetical protein